jgi:hypothetical protein
MVRSTGKKCVCLVMAVLFLAGAISAFGEEMILGYYTTTNEPLGAPNDVYDMLDAVDHGCNTIMVYNVHHPDIRQARRWLNSGALYGFKVYLELPYGAVQAGDVDTVVEYVNKFKDYPALRMWRMHDEPIASYTPSKDVNNFLPVYAAVKAADPCHPVTCTFAQTDSRLESWIYTVDFPDIDVYPCTVSQPAPSSNLVLVPERIKRAAEVAAAAGKGAPIYTAQAFEEPAGNPPFVWRLPTLQETRYMSFSAFTVGAEGILYWLFHPPGGTGLVAPVSHHENIVYPIMDQVRTVAPAIVSGLGDGGITITSNHDNNSIGGADVNDVTYIIKKYALDGYEDYYIIATNNLSSALAGVKFTMDLPIDTYQVEVLHEASQVFTFVQNGGVYELTDDFGDWDVHLYRIRGPEVVAGTCGDDDHPYPEGDANKDCSVDFRDFAEIGDYWLDCTDPLDANCL